MPNAYELEGIARAVCERARYNFVGPVGKGAFKETYKAIEGDVVHALKIYRPGARMERIERELAAMVKCNHPNIARLRQVETISTSKGGDCLYSIEEFLAGGTLAESVNRALLMVPEALALGERLVNAIGHIAANGLVHRDIKLENIMLREDGRTPVIVDFGLVRTLGLSSLTVTWAPHGPGTPYFSPPEQLCNDKHLIDWRADVSSPVKRTVR